MRGWWAALPFHGWLYDVSGACLEQPTEPAGSTFHLKVRQPAYRCEEHSGIVWAYMGPGEPPPLPSLDCFVAPGTHTFAFKGLWSCNWLQALEVGIDPAHASHLHRFFEDEDVSDAAYGRQFRAATIGADIPMTRLMREVPNPRLEFEETATACASPHCARSTSKLPICASPTWSSRTPSSSR